MRVPTFIRCKEKIAGPQSACRMPGRFPQTASKASHGAQYHKHVHTIQYCQQADFHRCFSFLRPLPNRLLYSRSLKHALLHVHTPACPIFGFVHYLRYPSSRTLNNKHPRLRPCALHYYTSWIENDLVSGPSLLLLSHSNSRVWFSD